MISKSWSHSPLVNVSQEGFLFFQSFTVRIHHIDYTSSRKWCFLWALTSIAAIPSDEKTFFAYGTDILSHVDKWTAWCGQIHYIIPNDSHFILHQIRHERDDPPRLMVSFPNRLLNTWFLIFLISWAVQEARPVRNGSVFLFIDRQRFIIWFLPHESTNVAPDHSHIRAGGIACDIEYIKSLLFISITF